MPVRNVAQALIDFIYPHHCIACGEEVIDQPGFCPACWSDFPFIAGLVCDGCGIPLPGEGADVHCDSCIRNPPPWDKGRAVLMYQDRARDFVLSLKYGDRQDGFVPAATWMARSASPMLRAGQVVIPVPLHWKRMLKRRYNQANQLAKPLARLLGLDFEPLALRRHIATQMLDGKTREERFEALENAIEVTKHGARVLPGRPVLIVDDVMTSGATLSACARACLAAGASQVSVIALARVGNPP